MFRLSVPEEGLSVVHDGIVVVAIGGCHVVAGKDVEVAPELCSAIISMTNLSIYMIEEAIYIFQKQSYELMTEWKFFYTQGFWKNCKKGNQERWPRYHKTQTLMRILITSIFQWRSNTWPKLRCPISKFCPRKLNSSGLNGLTSLTWSDVVVQYSHVVVAVGPGVFVKHSEGVQELMDGFSEPREAHEGLFPRGVKGDRLLAPYATYKWPASVPEGDLFYALEQFRKWCLLLQKLDFIC